MDKEKTNKPINLGDEVVVNYKDSYNLMRYRKYNGQKAVVVKYLPGDAPFVYMLKFLIEETDVDYVSEGSVLFKPEWLVRSGRNDKVYQKFLKESGIKEKRNPCSKCGGETVDYKNENWCPVCNKPSVHSVKTLNITEACLYLEVSGRPGINERIKKYLSDIGVNEGIQMLQLKFTVEEEKMNLKLDENVIHDLYSIKEAFKIKEPFVYIY